MGSHLGSRCGKLWNGIARNKTPHRLRWWRVGLEATDGRMRIGARSTSECLPCLLPLLQRCRTTSHQPMREGAEHGVGLYASLPSEAPNVARIPPFFPAPSRMSCFCSPRPPGLAAKPCNPGGTMEWSAVFPYPISCASWRALSPFGSSPGKNWQARPKKVWTAPAGTRRAPHCPETTRGKIELKTFRKQYGGSAGNPKGFPAPRLSRQTAAP